jgi:ribosomal protein L7Ae-like RNA K-turn-binding protein
VGVAFVQARMLAAAHAQMVAQLPDLGRDHFTLGQMLYPDSLNVPVTALLTQLVNFQRRAMEKEPARAKLKKRVVCGFKEVLKGIRSQAIKCIIVAPNIEDAALDGGLDELVNQALAEAIVHKTQIIFALNRRKLGACVGKKARISVVGLLDTSGTQQSFDAISNQATAAREQWSMLRHDPMRKLFQSQSHRTIAEM